MKTCRKQSFLSVFMAVLVYLAVNGCEHAVFEVEPDQLIVGKWNWIYAIIMSRDLHPPKNKFTPDSVSYTMQREFMENGQVNFYKNGRLTKTCRYEIKRFKILPTDEGTVTEIYINGYAAQLLFFHPDTMMIGNGWSDGIDYYYVRMR